MFAEMSFHNGSAGKTVGIPDIQQLAVPFQESLKRLELNMLTLHIEDVSGSFWISVIF